MEDFNEPLSEDQERDIQRKLEESIRKKELAKALEKHEIQMERAAEVEAYLSNRIQETTEPSGVNSQFQELDIKDKNKLYSDPEFRSNLKDHVLSQSVFKKAAAKSKLDGMRQEAKEAQIKFDEKQAKLKQNEDNARGRKVDRMFDSQKTKEDKWAVAASERDKEKMKKARELANPPTGGGLTDYE